MTASGEQGRRNARGRGGLHGARREAGDVVHPRPAGLLRLVHHHKTRASAHPEVLELCAEMLSSSVPQLANWRHFPLREKVWHPFPPRHNNTALQARLQGRIIERRTRARNGGGLASSTAVSFFAHRKHSLHSVLRMSSAAVRTMLGDGPGAWSLMSKMIRSSPRPASAATASSRVSTPRDSPPSVPYHLSCAVCCGVDGAVRCGQQRENEWRAFGGTLGTPCRGVGTRFGTTRWRAVGGGRAWNGGGRGLS